MVFARSGLIRRAAERLATVVPVRLVFVVNNYPPRVGGVENHVSSLAQRLADQGHEVVVHTLTEGPTGRAEEGGVTVHRWKELFAIGGLLGFPTPAAALGTWRAVVADPAVVSVHTRFFPLTWLGAAAARRAGHPVVLTEHGSDHVASTSPVIRWGSKLVDLTLGRWALRAVDAVVGVSDEVVAFVRRLSGVDASVFPNAIEPPSTPAEAPRPHAVFVGRIVPGKGWEDFLDAVAAQPATVSAEVLGDGPDLGALRERVARLGLGDRVAVRGRVPLSSVFPALAGAVLVNPSRLSEGFQTTLLEALAVGGRVVTYPVPGAELLKGDGAPVRVTRRSATELSQALGEELESPSVPWPSERVTSWTWPVRAQEFARLAGGVRPRRARRGRKPQSSL